MKKKKRKHKIFLPAAMLAFAFFLTAFNVNAQQPKRWEAPAEAAAVKNPFAKNPMATAKGKTLFISTCLPCHGAKGKGDGVAGVALNPRPQDLMSTLVQSQTDGAIYWKITTGKPPMASYNKPALTDEQRWQLVNYLRQLKSESK